MVLCKLPQWCGSAAVTTAGSFCVACAIVVARSEYTLLSSGSVSLTVLLVSALTICGDTLESVTLVAANDESVGAVLSHVKLCELHPEWRWWWPVEWGVAELAIVSD